MKIDADKAAINKGAHDLQAVTERVPIPKFKTLLARGWRRKCPQCGKGALYKRWLRLHEHCPVCGLHYLPNQGDLWGPLLFLDRALFVVPVIVLFYFRLWHPNLIMLLLIAAAMTYALIFTMPHRNGVSLAMDYLIRRKSGDLMDDDPAEKL